jgi:SPP1 family predicted phage head-tail adaptor
VENDVGLIEAGLLDREIVLQTATESEDATTGQSLLTWAATATIWAQWLPSGTREFWQARQIHSEIEGVYKTWYRSDVLPDVSRLVGHDGRLYDIKPVVEVGRREGILIPVVSRGEAA